MRPSPPAYLGTWTTCGGVVVRLPLSTVFPEALDDVVCEGTTVGVVLADLARRRPDLERRIWQYTGGLWVTVSLNGVDVRELQGFATVVHDGDELSLRPPIATEPWLGRLVALQGSDSGGGTVDPRTYVWSSS